MAAPKWDIEKAKALFDNDFTYLAIAKECSVSRSTISGYSMRHWPTRAIDIARHKKKAPGQKLSLAQEAARIAALTAGKITLPPLMSLTYLD